MPPTLKTRFTLGAQARLKGTDIVEDVVGVQIINGVFYVRCGERDTRWRPESELELVRAGRKVGE
jgi:hypothetical protein